LDEECFCTVTSEPVSHCRALSRRKLLAIDLVLVSDEGDEISINEELFVLKAESSGITFNR
jgi:hypothetical protein